MAGRMVFAKRFLSSNLIRKIKVENPIVEIDGDEMARVIWKDIKSKLILPYLDVKTVYFDLGLMNRNLTDDRVTVEAAEAVLKHKVGVKCSTITPDEARMEEFGLKKMWRSPNGTIRGILNGTVFREPIIVKNIRRPVPNWTKPIVVARHAYADQYLATDCVIDRPGKLEMVFHPKDKSEDRKWPVTEFQGPGVALGMYNVQESIRNFARACFEFALQRRLPLTLSTKDTILKNYDGKFKRIFMDIYLNIYKKRFEQMGLKYRHELIDSMVAQVLGGKGGLIWASKNYDGDVQSDMVAQGFGSIGLMTSILMGPDCKTTLTETAHGTVPSHYRQYENGINPSTNPVAMIFAWSRALEQRGRLDRTIPVIKFCERLEAACIKVIEEGGRTEDLINWEDVEEHKMMIDTQEFINRVKTHL